MEEFVFYALITSLILKNITLRVPKEIDTALHGRTHTDGICMYVCALHYARARVVSREAWILVRDTVLPRLERLAEQFAD